MEAAVFISLCPKGHPLQGKVNYCPFCGTPVVQPTGKAGAKVTAASPAVPAKLASAAKPVNAAPESFDPIVPVSVEALKTAAPDALADEVYQPKKFSKAETPSSHAGTSNKPTESDNPEPPKPTGRRGVAIIVIVLLLIFCVVMGSILLKGTSAPPIPLQPSAPAVVMSPGKRLPEARKQAPETPVITESSVPIPPEPVPKVVIAAPQPQIAPPPVKAECPATDIERQVNSMIASRRWSEASSYVNGQIETHQTCMTDKNILLLQDMALELKKYTREKNPRSAKSGFEGLIDKYGEKPALVSRRNMFNDLLNRENDCAASGAVWDPDNFLCKR